MLNYQSNTDAFSYTSGAFQPKAAALLIAIVTNTSGSSVTGISSSAPDSVKGMGLNWTQVSTLAFNSNKHRVSVYTAVTTTFPPSSGISVYFPGSAENEKRQSCIIQLVQLLGTNASAATNGTNAVSEIKQNTGSGNSGSINVGLISTPGTTMLGILGYDNVSANSTIEARWNNWSENSTNGVDVKSTVVADINSYDNSVQIGLSASANWGGLALKIEPLEVASNFSCSTVEKVNDGDVILKGTGSISCILDTAQRLNLQLNNDAETFIVRPWSNLQFDHVVYNNMGSFMVDKDAKVTIDGGIAINGLGHFFVGNGSMVTINGNVTLNDASLRVFGNLTINGNLDLNGKSFLFVGNLGKLTVNGTTTITSDNLLSRTLVNGGTLKTTTLITRQSKIEMSQGAILEANKYNDNNQPSPFITGPGGGCLAIVNPSGEIATQNNGFNTITASGDLKICLSSGITIGDYFVGNKGAAQVNYNCSGACATLLGSTLPITLTRFDGNMLSTGVSQLAWTVANNNDVSSFALEYSTNGRKFEPVGYLQKGSNNNYQLQHTGSHNGLIYYRLQLIDKQGNSSYSRIICLLHGSEKSTRIIGLSPTVTTNYAKVELYAATGQTIAYTIIDAAAHRVKTERKTVQKGLQQLNIDVHGLPQGLLFIKIQTEDGEQGTMKIMKL
ncbi:MAG TPA: hypothetical protein VLC98_08265 [Phnomibacter sp.]|nr:hypothetical protein [Phnomibacter sp.]